MGFKPCRYGSLLLIFFIGCSQPVSTQQTFPDGATVSVIGDEVNTSWRNSSPVISYEAKAGTNGIVPTVSVVQGTSVSTEALTAAQIAGGLSPVMMKMSPPVKGIFDTDSWAQSLVTKLDGSIFDVMIPGVSAPIVIVYHAPPTSNQSLESPAR